MVTRTFSVSTPIDTQTLSLVIHNYWKYGNSYHVLQGISGACCAHQLQVNRYQIQESKLQCFNAQLVHADSRCMSSAYLQPNTAQAWPIKLNQDDALHQHNSSSQHLV